MLWTFVAWTVIVHVIETNQKLHFIHRSYSSYQSNESNEESRLSSAMVIRDVIFIHSIRDPSRNSPEETT